VIDGLNRTHYKKHPHISFEGDEREMNEDGLEWKDRIA
jgi:hypothetical protein